MRDSSAVPHRLLVLSIFTCLAATFAAAQSPASLPVKSMGTVPQLQESYSSFASATPATDPADSVCARKAPGSTLSSPSAFYSTNGVLETSFNFKTVVDQQGLTRYCYLSGNGTEAPTLRVYPGDKLIIHFTNALPAGSSTSADTMQGMNMQAAATTINTCNATSMTSSSTNLHFHGLNVSPACHQDEVIHTLVQPQQEFDYTVQIPSNEPSGLYWYHPHPHGFSQGQVLGGATGLIIVEGVQNFNPAVKGMSERVFVIRDQAVPSSQKNASGAPGNDLSINYIPVTFPNYVPAVLNTPISTKEFWRVANTSANSVINLQILDAGVAQVMQIIGVDGVPLQDGSGNPITGAQHSMLLPPGARVEFIYTTPAAGHTASLRTTYWNNGPDGDADPGRTLATIVSSSGTNDGGLPRTSVAAGNTIPAITASRPGQRFSALNTSQATVQRTLYFSIKSDFSQFYITVNGQTPTAFNMDQSPNITVHSGTVEQWTIQNQSKMDHAFHIHQIHFRTLAINGSSVTDYTERDTINVPHWSGNSSDPYPSVTLLMDFSDPDIVGTFVYHCHILSHEDLGMMGEIQILPASDSPSIASLSTNYGAYFANVVVTGSNFGSSQGSSTLTFNGKPATSNQYFNMTWSDTSISAEVPSGATTGNVAVNVGSASSNGVAFTVYPDATVSGISPTSGSVGSTVTVTGTNLLDGQKKGWATFGSTVAAFTSQSSTQLQFKVPSGAATGAIRLHINGYGVNTPVFTVK